MYSPYIETLGGGERYMLTFAEYFLEHGHVVELWWDKTDVIEQSSKRFHLNLIGLSTNSSMYELIKRGNKPLLFIKKWFHQLSYDLIIWLSDGSIPLLFAKQNWLHFQVPFQIRSRSVMNQYKLSKIDNVLCNSQFTKQFIDRSFGVRSTVLYPPVDVEQFMLLPKKKEHIILSVGRFDQIMNAKRQDMLINVFKQMCDQGLSSWTLVMAGGLQHNHSHFDTLKHQAAGYPIEFKENIKWEELLDLYKRSTIYWHGAGFEVDDAKEPEKVEHFGMSIVESMAAGAIPIACKAGGVIEIITHGENGYLWDKEADLIEITKQVIGMKEKEKEKMILKAQKRAMKFSKEMFFREVKELLQ